MLVGISMEELLSTATLLTALLLIVVPMLWRTCWRLVWRPLVLSRSFKKQGVRGPAYKFLYGNLSDIKRMKNEARLSVLDPNSHDIFPRLFPYYHNWFSQYGGTFLYWNGTEPRICISDPELAKQILSNKFGFYTKPWIRPELLTLTGKGMLFIDGHDWVRHRRILNPAFSIDRLKDMTKLVVDSTRRMFKEWEKQSGDRGIQVKIEMKKEFQRLTADVIATVAFGSSYAEGIEVFRSQRELQKRCVGAVTDIFIPGLQYLPTPSNLQIWKLDRKMKNSLKEMIEARLNSKPSNSEFEYGDDMLGIMLTTAKTERGGNGVKMSMDEIMEECKTFFFAGHETTSNLLTWTIFLLSLHQNWQEKIREEVLRVCGKTAVPDANALPRFKLMNMVLMEALRLYGPVILMVREATEEMKLGELKIPKGTSVTIPLVKIHHDKKLWGEDANAFNPMRFANGVSRAADHPNALIAFSIGPRACIGQNFALIEAKTVIAMMMQRFRFCLAEDYKHTPANHLTLQPQFGMPVLLQPLDV